MVVDRKRICPLFLMRLGVWTCFVLVGIWVVSEFWAFGYSEGWSANRSAKLGRGDVKVGWAVTRGLVDVSAGVLRPVKDRGLFFVSPAWGRGRVPSIRMRDTYWWVRVPLWLLLVVVGAPTALGCWWWRRVPGWWAVRLIYAVLRGAAACMMWTCGEPRYRKRSWLRWGAKWVGVAACLLIAGGWWASRYRSYVLRDAPGSLVGYLSIQRGVVTMLGVPVRMIGGQPIPVRGSMVWVDPPEDNFVVVWPAGHFGAWWPKLTGHAPGEWDCVVPLWIPFAVCLMATLILWRRDRRPPQGRCRCGYDLTGNTSGFCPECGKGVRSHEITVKTDADDRRSADHRV